jgi:chemotaxis signal transduction protein
MGIGKLEDRLLILLDLTKLFQVQELNAMRSIQTNQTVGKAA